MTVLVGCDPEVFVRQNGVFKSAHGLIRGSKKDPYPVSKGAVQVDGMALEFNINPASSSEEFILNVQEVYDTLCKMVPDYEVVASPVADFDVAYMKAQPKEALELGCDPDFNGWKGGANPSPKGNRPFRTAAGHIHIGWTENENVQDPQHFNRCCHMAKQMDFYLGLPSIAYDKDNRRRELYGKAGCFRPKPYGGEYRTLSNVWLTSQKIMEWIFNNVQIGMATLMDGHLLAEKYGDIQQIINTSDWESAKKIIDAESIEVPNV